MSFRCLAAAAVCVVGLAAPALAQIPFTLSANLGNAPVYLPSGGVLNFASTIGQPETAQITLTYIGAGVATITTPPVVFNSTAFSINSATSIPATLNQGQTFVFSVQFLPESGALTTGQVSLSYSERTPVNPNAPCAGASAAGFCTTTGSLGFATQGAAFSFTLSYTLQSTQNATPLSPGGSIVFPPTQINTSAQAALTISNTGGAAGSVTSLSITGNAFRFQGIPVVPFTVAAGQNFLVQIVYQPTAATSDTGQIQIAFSGGSPVNIGLQGSGSSANLVYQVAQTSPPVAISPGGTLTLPSTNVGQSSSLAVRVLNTGNANGTITTLAVTGLGFQLSSPPPLPQTIAPNASVTFTITFTPTQPVAAAGSLTINSDTVSLSGIGLGSQLMFSYVASGNTITIGTANTSVVFSPVAVSQSAQLVLDVKNTGTLPASISDIGIVQANSPFTLSGVPALPAGLAPNSDFQITIKFTPVSVGFTNGTLQVDAVTIPLVASGTAPPPLPAYTLSGPSGNVAPLTQPLVALHLASPYAVAVSGTLTLSVTGNPTVDPAVQFSTGGLTVAFVIPANAQDAVFANRGTQIGLQTGTLVNSVTLTPTFATQAGGADLTPAVPKTLQFAIAPAPPVLINASVGTITTNSFVLTVTGYTVTGSLSAFNIQFTPSTGFKIPTTQFKIDLTQISSLWFQSSAALPFGGEFSLAVPFTFQGTVPTGQTLLNSIGSLSVSMANSLGTSNTLQANP